MKCSQWKANRVLTQTRCSSCDSLLMWWMSRGRGPCHYSFRGGGEGLQEKKALLIPTTAVLLWYHDQAVFVFRVGRDIFVFVYLCECVCVCVKACVEGCVGGCTADMLIQGRRQGRGRVTMSNLTELRWRGMKSVCLWRSYVTNLTTCLSVYQHHEHLQIADI